MEGKKPDYYAGLDPDIDKSGYAEWNVSLKAFERITTHSFFEAIYAINRMRLNYNIHVIIEAGWLNRKSNYHNRPGQKKSVGERIAKNVGENHAVGKLFEQFCIYNNIPYTLVRPAKTKMNAQAFKALTKWEGRTNQEERDAAILVWQR